MQSSLRKFSRLVAILVSVATFGSMKAQLSVSTALTPQQLVQNVLLGQGITASNITFTGYRHAIGKFISVNTGLGIDSGIIMTTGSVLANDSTFFNAGPAGPNLSGSDGAQNQQSGTDPDLTAIAGTSTYDAAILAFDFVSQSDSVKFNYVFGSEEYDDYVNSINDVFAYFLSGVSVTLAPTNIALIPNTSTPVTINNVNNGNAGTGSFASGPCTNCAYFNDNPTNSGTYNLQYDGFTHVLTARYPVQCGETYHIKIAIADAGDHVFDSGVFLEAGSFKAGDVHVSSQTSYNSQNDSTLYESCGQACIVFSRTSNLAGQDTANLTFGGNAINGVDFYPAFPSQVIFHPGQDSIVICVSANQDNITEGLETFTMLSSTHGVCIQNVDSMVLYISDFNPINVDIGPDTAICSSSPITFYSGVTGGVEPYNYLWSTGATTPDITVSPTVTTTYYLSVTDPCGSAAGIDSVTVFLPTSAPLTTSTSGDLTLCAGDPALIYVNAANGSMPYNYTWTTISGSDSVPLPHSSANGFTPGGSGTYVVLTRDGCNAVERDTIDITVQDCNVIPPNVFTPNGDGVNDMLVFSGLDKFPGTSLEVFTRWGNKVYESADYHNDWNGSGTIDGTYYYILRESDGTTMTGFLTVFK
jgi:gliding motility-associated-like protein